MKALAVAAMVLAVSLAGCGDAPESTPAPTTTSTGTSTTSTKPTEPITRFDLLVDFSFEECVGLVHVSIVDAAAAQALLPDGFTARAANLPGVGPLPDRAEVHVEMFDCARYASPTATVEPAFFGRTYIPIEPVDAFGITADAHAYALRMIGGEDTFPGAWRQAGYDATNGTSNVTQSSLVPGVEHMEAVAGEYRVLADGTPIGADASFTFAMYAQLDDTSHLVWTGSFEGTESFTGQGQLSTPSDDPAASARTDGNGFATAYEPATFAAMNLWRDMATRVGEPAGNGTLR